VIVLAAATALVLLMCGAIVRSMVQQRAEGDDGLAVEMAPARAGLSEAQFARVQVVSFSKASCAEVEARNNECIISMDEFEDGDHILRLPCEHQLTYHLGLQYFQTSTKCPLCRKDVAEWADEQERAAAPAGPQPPVRPAPAVRHARVLPLDGAFGAEAAAEPGAGAAASTARGVTTVHVAGAPAAATRGTVQYVNPMGGSRAGPAGERPGMSGASATGGEPDGQLRTASPAFPPRRSRQ